MYVSMPPEIKKKEKTNKEGRGKVRCGSYRYGVGSGVTLSGLSVTDVTCSHDETVSVSSVSN